MKLMYRVLTINMATTSVWGWPWRDSKETNIGLLKNTAAFMNILRKSWKLGGNLPRLESLDLSRNWLTKFDLNYPLPNLKKLSLSHNSLTSISESITTYQTLTELDLSYNELNYIPDVLLKLPNLKRVNLKGNQIYKGNSVSNKLTKNGVKIDLSLQYPHHL